MVWYALWASYLVGPGDGGSVAADASVVDPIEVAVVIVMSLVDRAIEWVVFVGLHNDSLVPISGRVAVVVAVVDAAQTLEISSPLDRVCWTLATS